VVERTAATKDVFQGIRPLSVGQFFIIMPPFTFTPRTYLHFDSPVNAEVAQRIATDTAAVARHSFYPFIQYNVVTQKIRKREGGGVELRPPKVRPIAYAAHKDSHIFSHYSAILVERYEQELQARGLHEVVTAFRSLDHRRNIHFANDAFEFIRGQGECSVLASDISDYFGTIQHERLKAAWCRLMGVPRLPDDHFAVFKAVTRYATVDRLDLCRMLSLDPENPREDRRQRFCSAAQFREIVRGNRLCSVNRRGFGIPQGSPISAILSNLYLLEFDEEMHTMITGHGGFYRRYCDDILFVVPTPEARGQVLTMMRTMLTELGLTAHPDKTEVMDFPGRDMLLPESRTLNYLGFTFDGVNKRIRPASIARYYKKMRAGVSRARAIRYRVNVRENNRNWRPLRTRKLFILYSYLGRHNFLSYAFQAAHIMNDDGIKRQVKAHWRRLLGEIED